MTHYTFKSVTKAGISNLPAVEDPVSFNTDIQLELQKICQPLEKNYGIKFFTYRCIYNNGKLLYLANNTNWMNYAHKNNFLISNSFYERAKYLTQQKTTYYLWPETPPKNDEIYCSLYQHDIWNGFSVYKKQPDCIESFAFVIAEEKRKEVRDACFLKQDILERFILYFKDKLFPLIAPVKNKILISHNFSFNNIKDEEDLQFFANTPVNNFYIRINGQDVKLTERQQNCLSLFAKGKKMKEIGNVLNLSERTVEFYLRNIMKKAACQTKSQLICCFHDGI
jgi:DNA-binding CsgD family transcriptional regulator